MATYKRAKRVSDPLDERVKDQLLHGTSNYNSDVDRSIFSSLIHGFFDDHDDDNEVPPKANRNEYSTTSDSNDDDDDDSTICAVQDLLDPSSDPSFLRLHSDVIRVADELSTGSCNKHRQAVMTRLREIGYNAGICKVKWESSGGLIVGSYEYIDVLVNDDDDDKQINKRYIVDMEFKAQFEVARATEEYEKVVGSVPRVLVGREEGVRKAVKLVAEAAKRSMKSRDMSLPPWRKGRYLLAKWFGPYRRIVNSLPSSFVNGVDNIKCRSVVGFKAEAGKVKWSELS